MLHREGRLAEAKTVGRQAGAFKRLLRGCRERSLNRFGARALLIVGGAGHSLGRHDGGEGGLVTVAGGAPGVAQPVGVDGDRLGGDFTLAFGGNTGDHRDQGGPEGSDQGAGAPAARGRSARC